MVAPTSNPSYARGADLESSSPGCSGQFCENLKNNLTLKRLEIKLKWQSTWKLKTLSSIIPNTSKNKKKKDNILKL
jgi:hypothetical protein